jgi:hypothetical protein
MLAGTPEDRRIRRRCSSQRPDQGEQVRLLAGGLHSEPLEVVGESNVRMEAGRILVEVEERLGASVEHASLPLDEIRHAADLGEQRLELIEGVRPRMSHQTTVRRADSGPDVVVGLGGNDEINGSGGNDTICGGNGDDTIAGDDGGLTGGGADTLFGDNGNDMVFGMAGVDTVRGGNGDDIVIGGPGNDAVHGDKGNDLVFGAFGNDTLTGDQGDDFLNGDLPFPASMEPAPPGAHEDPNVNTDSCDGGSGLDAETFCEIQRGIEQHPDPADVIFDV